MYITRLKCEIRCKKIQLIPLLGKNEITFRTTQYFIFSVTAKFTPELN